MDNGCWLNHDIVVSPSITTDTAGRSAFPVRWPIDPSTRGVALYTTFMIVDPGANSLGVVLSNTLLVTQGGNP